MRRRGKRTIEWDPPDPIKGVLLALLLVAVGWTATTLIAPAFGTPVIQDLPDGSTSYRHSWKSLGVITLCGLAISAAGWLVTLDRQFLNWMTVVGGGVIVVFGTLWLATDGVTIGDDRCTTRSWWGLQYRRHEFRTAQGINIVPVGKGRRSYPVVRLSRPDGTSEDLFRLGTASWHLPASVDVIQRFQAWHRNHTANPPLKNQAPAARPGGRGF